MEYSERYKSFSVRFSPEEWLKLVEQYEAACKRMEIQVSKHSWMKMLIKRGIKHLNAV